MFWRPQFKASSLPFNELLKGILSPFSNLLSVDLTCENQETWLHSLWHDVGQNLQSDHGARSKQVSPTTTRSDPFVLSITDNNSFLHARHREPSRPDPDDQFKLLRYLVDSIQTQKYLIHSTTSCTCLYVSKYLEINWRNNSWFFFSNNGYVIFSCMLLSKQM